MYRNILDVLYVVYLKKIVNNLIFILVVAAFQPHLKQTVYFIYYSFFLSMDYQWLI